MIILTRLGGAPVAVNPDLIERAECTPDTVVTLVDGHKLVVVEPIEELQELVREWRGSIAASAHRLVHLGAGGDPVPCDEAELLADDVMAHQSAVSSIANVLRLPHREG